MEKEKGAVLIVTPFFRPNIGGAETYVFELCEYLRTHGYYVNVLTYQPVTTPGVNGKGLEKKENMAIRRYQWIGFNLFHKLEKLPFLNFLYLTPYLLLRSLIWMVFNHKKVEIIDAQGFNSAFIAVILKKLFRKKAVVTVLSLYNFVPGSTISKLVNWIISKLDLVITEKGKSKQELINISIDENKIIVFNQWVDQTQFKPAKKEAIKKELGLEGEFLVLFVGRANPEKGALVLLEAAKRVNKDIHFAFITDRGPVTEELKNATQKMENAIFIGAVDYEKLHKYYQAGDIFCIPSQYEEGVARVIPEAISCGTPIVASNRGSIPYVLDEKVALIVEPTVDNLAQSIQMLYNDKDKLLQMTANCSAFANEHFSTKNLTNITNGYERI